MIYSTKLNVDGFGMDAVNESVPEINWYLRNLCERLIMQRDNHSWNQWSKDNIDYAIRHMIQQEHALAKHSKEPPVMPACDHEWHDDFAQPAVLHNPPQVLQMCLKCGEQRWHITGPRQPTAEDFKRAREMKGKA